MRKIQNVVLFVCVLVFVLGMYTTTYAMTNEEGAEWARSRIGQSIDTDGMYGAQCKDFVNAFTQQNFGVTFAGNANALITCSLPSGWSRIKNTADFIPQPGDIALWDYSTYGHTGIILSANINTFISVDQNWYNASDNGSPAAQVQHNYTSYNFWGVLRPPYNNDTTKPTITNAKVSCVSSKGYLVTCTVSDNVGISKVCFPTWTETNGQDDLKSDWTTNSACAGTISGNTATYYVSVTDHSSSIDKYITHIYAYDKAGNHTSVAVSATIPNGLQPISVKTYNGHVYAAFNEPYTWTEAQEICQSMGGHLVTITSAEEEALVIDMLAGARGHIGASDAAAEGTWKWCTGEAFSYTNWSSGEPNNSNNEDYAELNQWGTWNDAANTVRDNRGFVLEIDSTLAIGASTTYGSSVYNRYDVAMPWEVAEAYCELQGGYLATVSSAAENGVVAGLLNGGSKAYYLLGITDKVTEGTWKYVDGTACSYTNWNSGEPNNLCNEDYVAFGLDARWNDTRSYSNTVGFVCETRKPLVVNVSVNTTSVEVDTKVTITGSASGGSGSYKYLYFIHNLTTNEWVHLTGQDTYITSTTYEWTPDVAGTYEVGVKILDSEGNTGYMASGTAPVVTVYPTLEASVKVSATAITKGNKITITGEATGGSGSYTYLYFIHNTETGEWTHLTGQDTYITSKTYEWTPDKVGSYEVGVKVKDSVGNIGHMATGTASVVTVYPILTVSAETDVPALIVGDFFIITGTATGGSGNYSYKYLAYNKDSGIWSDITESYIADKEYNWDTTETGNYELYVEVKDGTTGTIVRSNAVSVLVKEKLQLQVQVSPGKVSVGDKVTIKATASGGSGSYVYKYRVFTFETSTWIDLTTTFITDNKISFIAEYANDYIIVVEVEDATGLPMAGNEAGYVDASLAPLTIEGTVNTATLQKCDKLTITGTATGGDEKYTYSYLVYNRDTKTWARLTAEFTDNNSFTWTAGSSGTRDFYVEVKDGTGKVVRSKPVTVKTGYPELKLTSVASATEITKGNKLTLTGSATGGDGKYTYSYLVYNRDTKTWARLTSAFTSSKTFTWAAGSTGTRDFYIEVKDGTGKVVRSEAMTVVTKNPELTITANASAATVTKGTKVTITSNAAGGDGRYTYSYLVYNRDTKTWARLTSAFTSSKTFTWTAGSVGTRDFYVEVKDSTGKVVRSNAITVVTKKPELSIVGNASLSQVVKGGKIIFTGTAAGGEGGYTYSYLVYNRTTKEWARLTPSFTSSNTFTWTAGSNGVRDFYIEAKDSTGKVVRSKAIVVSVGDYELELVAKAYINGTADNFTITIMGIASGGSGNYSYKYSVYNADTKQWFDLTSSYVAENTFVWSGVTSGYFWIYMDVKDNTTGQIVRSNQMGFDLVPSPFA